MIIAFSGAQCTGKTTLIEQLSKDTRFLDFRIGLRTIRKLADKGVKINERGDDETQLKVFQTHMDNLEYPGNQIVDRCLLDGMAYTDYMNKHQQISQKNYNICYTLYKSNIRFYDYIFYTPPEIEIVSDGVRSVDPVFRKEVAECFGHLIGDTNKKNVIVLTGSVEDRLNQIYNTLGIE